MKIEMGESLFYSWLRHVKECQIVQTNWKVSRQWNLMHEDELEKMMSNATEYFQTRYKYSIFKQNSSLYQLLQQGECDAFGICIQNGINNYYTVDVAFHEAGLNYGSREETIMKVIAKSIRTAMILYGYLDTKKAELIFASPKINPAIRSELDSCTNAINALFRYWGFEFELRIIANNDFNKIVLQPILQMSDGIADTSELFMRSYQMYTMFNNCDYSNPVHKDSLQNEKTRMERTTIRRGSNDNSDSDVVINDEYKELKIGQLVRVVLRRILESERINEEELKLLQQPDYCKLHFDLQYPLLVNSDNDYEKIRYYKDPVKVNGTKYMICSQWYEVPANNDRPYLLKWLQEHK